MKAIIERIKDFLEDRPVASDATGMFIERDGLREIVDAVRLPPMPLDMFHAKRSYPLACAAEEKRVKPQGDVARAYHDEPPFTPSFIERI